MNKSHNGTVCFVGFGYVGKESYHLIPSKHAIFIDTVVPSDDYVGVWVNPEEADIDAYLSQSDVVVISVPTELKKDESGFNYRTLISYLERIAMLDGAKPKVVIRSTLGTDFPAYAHGSFLYIPEFLTEAQMDEQLPNARLVLGYGNRGFGNPIILNENKYLELHEMTIEEAIHTKLFSNAYLALRLSFMNEVDTECRKRNMDSAKVLGAIQADPRIGKHYARTSFGYGGKCLPKDVLQVSSRLRSELPLIQAIHDSNEARKEYTLNQILQLRPSVVGVHRLINSKDAESSAHATSIEIIENLTERGIHCYVYEPQLNQATVSRLVNNANVYWADALTDLGVMDVVISEIWDDSLDMLEAPILCLDTYAKP